jgi:hypothetical protein
MKLSLILIALGLLLYYYQRRTYIVQYLYFLRIPILIALTMILLPFFAGDNDPKIIQNWFEVDLVGLAIVVWLAILLAWAVMHMSGVLFVNVATRNKLPFLRKDHDCLKKMKKTGVKNPVKKNRIPARARYKKYRLPGFALLALPIVWACLARSNELSMLEKSRAVSFGVLSAGATFLVLYLIRKYLLSWIRKYLSMLKNSQYRGRRLARVPLSAQQSVKNRMGRACRFLLTDEGLESFAEGLEEEWDEDFTRRRARAFLILIGCLYVLGWFVLRPDRENILVEVLPAFSYVLVLLIIWCFLLSLLTLMFDRYRVPLLLLIVLIASLNNGLFDTDHYFSLRRSSCPSAVQELDEYNHVDAFRDWAGKHSIENHPAVVVIAASGGGITAARWTAQVLTNLQRDQDLAWRFGDSVTLISAVSGGSVGSMYFVDAYADTGAPIEEGVLEEIVDAASRSSLGSVGWGLIYPDFWRLFVPIVPAKYDRGWALEQRWRSPTLSNDSTLTKWREGIRQGWRPTLISNATVFENGQRLVIAPVDIPTKGTTAAGWHAQKLIHPGDDLAVVTAARLSATFPYVTPISRPNLPDDCEENSYHVADGGYYDNFGVVTVVDYLRDVHPLLKKEGRRILLVQIRASNPWQAKPPERDRSYLSIASGPLKTILQVRTPSQIVRNERYISSLKAEWGDSVGLETVIFQLDQDGPLSWHLSQSDKDKISAEWCSEANQSELIKLRKFMGVERRFVAASDATKGPRTVELAERCRSGLAKGTG